MTGEDASFIHLERLGEPCHTLKVVVLDPSRRGRPVTLAELRSAVAAHLSLYPRARQRVLVPPVFKGLPFWVDDARFDLDLHTSERVLPAPGGRAELDDVCSELASSRLDLTRPLWDATLVHGLDGGRQAVVIRLHHALSDGMAVVRLFERVTTTAPGEMPTPPPPDDWRPEPLPTGRELVRAAVADAPVRARAALDTIRWGWEHRDDLRAVRATFAERDDLHTSSLAAPYTWMNPRFGTRRLCASGSLPLEDLRTIKSRLGVTLNVVLLAVLAGAIRKESEARGRDLDAEVICGLGIAIDAPDSDRTWGNNVSSMYVSLHTTEPDPRARLAKLARSAADTLALHRQATEGRPHTTSDLAPRLGPVLGKALSYRREGAAANVAAGNVPGPARTRYFGTIEVTDICSWAVLVLTVGMQVTVYSYAGTMEVGVLVVPEAHGHPARFMDRMADSLQELLELTDAAPG